jgi:hypothetical protein
MFINFNGFSELNEMCTITVRIGNTIIQQQNLPLIFCQQQFMQLVQQLAKDQRPMSVICTRQVFTEEGKQIENSLTFNNLSWIKEFEKEDK